MNKRLGLISVGIALFIALALFVVLNWGKVNNGDNSDQFVSNNWTKKYVFDSKHPYGLHLFFHLVKLKNPKQKISLISTKYQYDSIIQLKEKATFMMIGDSIGLTADESELLQTKLINGSSLLVSASIMSANLLDTFQLGLRSSFVYERKVKVDFDSDTISFYSIFQNDTIYKEWYGFSELYNPSPYRLFELMRFRNLSALLKLELPKSTLLIHTIPSTLQNVNAKSKNAFKYINHILSQLPTNQTIYFVDFAQVTNTGEDQEQIEPENNLLQLIYENRILLNSMMLLFFAGFLFVLFRTKRRRSVVPVFPKDVNITKTFAETIGSIYLNKQNPSSMLALQKKNFFDTMYRYYYTDLNKMKDELVLVSLAEKTNYPLKELQHLVHLLQTTETNIGNDYIVQVAKLQHKFYKHCGIIEDKIDSLIHRFEVSRNSWISGLYLTVGFFSFILGLYLLTKSNPSGVLLWIAGSLLIGYGALRFIRPHLIIEKDRIIYYNALGLPTTIALGTVTNLRLEGTSIELVHAKRTIRIPLFDTLKIDISQLKRFIHLTKFYDN
jgi:hypothetical protein